MQQDTDHKGPWEVVEEMEEPTTDESADTPPADSTQSENLEVENQDTFVDNSPNLEEPVAMSHSHDYAQQNLNQFETPSNTPTTSGGEYYHYPRPPRKIPYLLIGGIALGLVGLALVVKLLFFRAPSESKPSAADILIESTSGSPSPLPTPTATPIAQTDKEDLKIQVLNGSGVVGAAGKLAKVLEAEDYKNITTSNASSYTAQGVKIQVKDGQTALGDDLEKALTDDYEDISVRDNLDDSSDVDAVITLGKQPGDKSGDVQGASDSADLKTPSDKKN